MGYVIVVKNNMENYLPVLGLVTFGSLCGLVGGLFILWNKRWGRSISAHSIPFAAGVMLTVSLVDVLPEAIDLTSPKMALGIVLGVMVVAFFFEQFFMHLHHHEEHERTIGSAIPLVVVGDTIHNFMDGAAIAAAYLVDPKLGVLVATATFLHELPHEIGDFGLMIAAGWKNKRIIITNLLSALSSFLGAILVLVFATNVEENLGFLLAIAGGLLLYISASDLLPEVHHKHKGSPWHQAGLFLGGVLLMWFLAQVLPA